MLLGEGIRIASGSTSNLSPFVSPEMEEARPGRKRKSPENGAPTRVAGSYQRTKAGNACLICRARKTKCDNVWPACGFCKKTGGECTYTQPSPQRRAELHQTISYVSACLLTETQVRSGQY
jgi:hypothetical protein